MRRAEEPRRRHRCWLATVPLRSPSTPDLDQTWQPRKRTIGRPGKQNAVESSTVRNKPAYRSRGYFRGPESCLKFCGRFTGREQAAMTDRLRRPRQVADVGSDDRLAGVRFLTRLPSRTLSRSRYAGRELRLGIVSMCMTHASHDSPSLPLSHGVAYMATSPLSTRPQTRRKPPFRRALPKSRLVFSRGTSV